MIAPLPIAIHAQKPHLPALPTCEGQRRLVWWLIGPRDDAERNRRSAMLRQLEVTDRLRERLIAGEVTPTNAIAARIAHASAGAVRLDDWTAAPEGAWGDCPASRPQLRLVA